MNLVPAFVFCAGRGGSWFGGARLARTVYRGALVPLHGIHSLSLRLLRRTS